MLLVLMFIYAWLVRSVRGCTGWRVYFDCKDEFIVNIAGFGAFAGLSVSVFIRRYGCNSLENFSAVTSWASLFLHFYSRLLTLILVFGFGFVFPFWDVFSSCFSDPFHADTCLWCWCCRRRVEFPQFFKQYSFWSHFSGTWLYSQLLCLSGFAAYCSDGFEWQQPISLGYLLPFQWH